MIVSWRHLIAVVKHADIHDVKDNQSEKSYRVQDWHPHTKKHGYENSGQNK